MEAYLVSQTIFMLLLCGLIFVVVGGYMYKFPPKSINLFYGYRTNRSMQSQDRWDFAQTYSAKIMIQSGVVMLVLSLLKQVVTLSTTAEMTIGFIMLIGNCIVMLVKTETELKQRFN